ncbi:MAG: amino acid adenylation domain-containing protein, partial [Clostridia bacterium]|nr:amino acid adenylation domain-containing protein [Clostridia bacterium]
MSFDEKYYPLSQSEYGIYYECQSGTTAYNLPLILPLEGFDTKKIIVCVKKFFELHPYLFTQFTLDTEGNVKKHIVKTDLNIESFKINSLDEIKVTPFEMTDSYLYRVEIFTVAGKDHLFIDVHHTIFDGYSIALFLRSIFALYDGEELKAEEKDANRYALLEEKMRASDEYASAKNYYTERFSGLDCSPSIPEDIKEDKVRYKSYKKKLNVKRSDVASFVKKTGCKTSAFFLSAFGYLVSKINMENEALFSTVHNGRNSENDYAVGMFVKTIPFYLSFEKGETVASLLQKATQEHRDNVKNDLYSFADIAKDLSLSTDMIFAYQGDYMYKTDYHGKEIRIDQCPVSDGKGSLAIEIHRDTDGFYFWCEYRADLYTDFTAGQLMALYDTVLEEFMHKEYLSDISLLSEKETLILDKQNESETYIFDSEHTVLDYFEKHVKEAPGKELVVFKDRRYTYADAEKISAKIASKLCSLGVGAENVVSVLIDKSEFIVLASLGVLRSGAAYQPLDPSYPSERLEFMVKDSDAKVLILDRKYDDRISGFTGEKIYTDEIPSLPDAVCPDIKHDQSDLFIMLYTSGTTGLPKGVMLEHGSILNFSLMCNKLYDEDSSMKSSAYASYGFDADMMDIYPAITAGGCVFVIPEEMRLDLEQLGEYFNTEGITHSIITTQVGRQAVEELEFKTLKHLTVGGEKLVPLQPPKGYVLHNAYGPTEGTVFCSQQPVDKLYYRVPIGRHIDGYKFYILDEHGKGLPRGVKGELCISGSGVARGYLNRDIENKKAFIKNPFESDAPFDRIYRTGDIVRFLEDGTVDFIGRNDGQVKIRGFRVELTEVEQIIRQYPGIKDATVKDFTDPAGVKFIAAYIVSDTQIDVDDLASFIGKNKPPYMVPPFIIQLDKIPLNQNQKVNKKALPVPQPKKAETVPPETENEKKIFAILSEILGHDSFGVTTDIFEAGLTSVSSIRFTVRLSKAFSRPFKAGDLENMNTVRALAKAAEETVEEKVYQKLDKYPLTKTQEGIFIECLSSPGSTNYNIPMLFKLSDEIDTQKLKCAVEQSLNAHPYVMSILSTDENGDVVALRKDYAPVVDVVTTGLPDRKTLVKPFKIIGENLYRAVIFDGADGKYLFFDIHHIVCDGTGMAVLISDITTAYEGKELEAETYSGYEMALEERDERQSERFEEAKKYYASLLAETDGEYLPKKSLKLSEKKLMAEEFDSLADVEKTKAFIKQNNLTLDAYFNFLFGYTLSLFNYKEDSLYTTVYNGRGDARTANAVSMLVKTLPVYIKFDLRQKLTDAVASLKKQTEASRKNSVYSFSEIASDNGIGADIIFAYQGDAFEFDSICGKKAEIQVLELDMPKAALSVQTEIKGGKFVFRFEYDASVYNADAIKDMCRAYETLIESAMSAETVGDLKFLSEEDKRMYDFFNRTEEEKQDVTFNKLLEAQVLRVPDKTAVIAKDGEYTYKELNETANRIANSLKERGVGLNDKVAVLMPRVKDAYAVRQGVMKAGAAFVPIDPVYPDERIEYILNDSSAKAVVSTGEILTAKKNCFKDTSASGYDVEELKNNTNCANPDIDIPTDALCYIIYTSGSTGKPKGVMIMHKNLVNLCVDGKNIATQMYRDAGDVVSGSFASLSFDASVIEESVPLSHGYTAVIISEEEIENPILLSEKMISKGINFIFATPSYVTNGLDCPQYV